MYQDRLDGHLSMVHLNFSQSRKKRKKKELEQLLLNIPYIGGTRTATGKHSSSFLLAFRIHRLMLAK